MDSRFSLTRVAVSILLILAVLSGATFIWDKAFESDTVMTVPLTERVKNHPDAVKMGPDWYRITIKENLSDTEYDWRFDRRMIETSEGHVYIGHRMEQNSGSTPDSNWVIEYSFRDMFGDGTLDDFSQDRFISIKHNNMWLRISPYWPDGFRYPSLTEKEIENMYKEEMEYWENKL